MPNLKEDDKAMRDMLTNAKVMAVVGHYLVLQGNLRQQTVSGAKLSNLDAR